MKYIKIGIVMVFALAVNFSVVARMPRTVNADDEQQPVAQAPTAAPTAVLASPDPTMSPAPTATPTTMPQTTPTVVQEAPTTVPTSIPKNNTDNPEQKNQTSAAVQSAQPTSTPAPPTPTPTKKPLAIAKTQPDILNPVTSAITSPATLIEHTVPEDFYNVKGLSTKGTYSLLAVAAALISAGLYLIHPDVFPRRFSWGEKPREQFGPKFANI